MINGKKATMLEGGSRVPFIASRPDVTPAGQVCKEIISFADPHATSLKLAGVKPPKGVELDGSSFAPQLRGQPGAPANGPMCNSGTNGLCAKSATR